MSVAQQQRYLEHSEIRAKLSAYQKEHPNSGRLKKGENHPNYGKPLPPETRAKLSITKKGKLLPPETRAKMSIAHKGKSLPPEIRVKISASNKGNHHTPEARAKMSAAAKNNPERMRKMHMAMCHKQTKPEKLIEGWLNELLPNEYKYVGSDGSTIINHCFPDFFNINGKKKVIEFFGDHWHGEKKTGRTREQEELRKYKAYQEVGFDCLIIWGKELKEQPEQVKKRIIAFHRARHKHLEAQPCLL